MKRIVVAPFALLLGVASAACTRDNTQTSDPVVLGMKGSDAPYYDDGETKIYQVARAISLPVISPSAQDVQQLASAPTPPFPRAPWIAAGDLKVQVTWTLSNLDGELHNAEILIDPWNEFARYVPGLNVGDEQTIPDLSGIQLLVHLEPQSRRSGTFTFDDFDELATDLATAENIIAKNAGTSSIGVSANAMVNHAFDLQNRSGDGDKLLAGYVPNVVPGLVGFDLGLRSYAAGSLAIEIVVEWVDQAGTKTHPDAALKSDGSMWLTPESTISPPMGMVR